MEQDTLTIRERLECRRALLRHDAARRTENALAGLARRLPRRLRYWAFITVAAEATQDPTLADQEVPGVPLEELLRVSHRRLAEKQPAYPYRDGDTIVLGPEVFVSSDGSVLSWRGENYVPQPAAVAA